LPGILQKDGYFKLSRGGKNAFDFWNGETTITSYLFLIAILGMVIYLTLTKKDEIPPEIIKADVD